ncbi:MAG: hypothetical protein U9N40_02725 [Euryarchaeota archaeon]|nr:hypothetical protein [Euryarchaeota archaeon]
MSQKRPKKRYIRNVQVMFDEMHPETIPPGESRHRRGEVSTPS